MNRSTSRQKQAEKNGERQAKQGDDVHFASSVSVTDVCDLVVTHLEKRQREDAELLEIISKIRKDNSDEILTVTQAVFVARAAGNPVSRVTIRKWAGNYGIGSRDAHSGDWLISKTLLAARLLTARRRVSARKETAPYRETSEER